MKFILGKKIEMSQLFDDKGNVVPVTLVQAGPCTVTQIKKDEGNDKYNAVQLGFGKKKSKSMSKALRGHLKDLGDFRWLSEFSVGTSRDLSLKKGDRITVDIFNEKEKVKVIGNSKGRGFQGVVKRHGFHGQQASHGTKDQERAPGSIGATEPARVFKGMRMPGHMGNAQVTVKNLEIVKIDKDKNILYLKGAIPGSRGSLIRIMADGELKYTDKKQMSADNVDRKKDIKENEEDKDKKESHEISHEKNKK